MKIINLETKEILKHKFVKKIMESFFGKIGITGFSFIFSLIRARLYGAESIGEFAFVMSILSFATIFTKCGMDSGLIYFIPKTKDKYISFAFLVSLITSLIAGLGIYLYSDNILLYLAIPSIWLSTNEALFMGIYRSKGKIKEYYIQGLIGLSVNFIVVVTLFYYRGIDSKSLVYGLIISSIVNNFLFFINTKQMFKKIYFSGEFIKYSIPLIITAIMGTLMGNIDILMIGKMIDKSNVGIYQVASSLAGTISIILVIFNTVFAPKVSELYHKKEIEKLRILYGKSTRILCVVSTFIIVIMCLLSPFILKFYGNEFVNGKWAFIFRAIGQLINAGVGSVWLVLAMTGKPKLQMWGTFGACIINILLNYMLIPTYGINGAAIASMVSIGFINILGYILVSKYLKIKVYKYF